MKYGAALKTTAMAISDKNQADAAFWCNIAAESIYNSADKRSRAAESLQKLVIWVFGLFATGGFVSTVFGQIKGFNDAALISFGIAFFLLTISYCIASNAQYPVAKSYKPADPVSIAQSFSQTVKMQAAIFNCAVITCSLGFFFLAGGILLQFAHIKDEPERKGWAGDKLSLMTTAQLHGKIMYIPMIITAHKGDSVDIRIDNNTSTGVAQQRLFSTRQGTDTAGRLYYSWLYNLSDTEKITAVKVSAALQKKDHDTIVEESKMVILPVAVK